MVHLEAGGVSLHSALTFYFLFSISMLMKEIGAVARFTFIRDVRKSSYWSGIIWPFSVIVLISVFFLEPLYGDSKGMVVDFKGAEVILAVSVITIGLVFSPIMGSESEKDRSSKVSDLLWSMSGPRTQLIGRFLGVILLMIFSMSLYILFFFILNEYSAWLRDAFKAFEPVTGVIGACLLLQATLWILVLSANIGMLVKNKSHLSQAISVIPAYTIICSVVNAQLSGESQWGNLIKKMVWGLPVLSQLFEFHRVLIHVDSMLMVLLSVIVQFALWLVYSWFVLRLYSKYS